MESPPVARLFLVILTKLANRLRSLSSGILPGIDFGWILEAHKPSSEYILPTPASRVWSNNFCLILPLLICRYIGINCFQVSSHSSGPREDSSLLVGKVSVLCRAILPNFRMSQNAM